MADIELVIKIDEHDKNVIKRFVQGDGCEDFPPSIIEDLIRAVYFGKPLPKGHGRLIDADAITKDFNTFQDSFAINLLDMGRGRLNIVCTAPTIIEADKGEEVGGATP